MLRWLGYLCVIAALVVIAVFGARLVRHHPYLAFVAGATTAAFVALSRATSPRGRHAW
ncbi:hypothetical protein [Paractinoplanes toevensis]|uniref:Uncharacterized protein n=1 Tax=Paractinoplanes toevensis TaxID=571911 RepID=A0A919W166_9ACTN|nr:hypothetical protein [Actinoplanes toevensis]GIM92102.1 hypothetical protein Ato02nite_038950 [Actinoplanes toevensis]